MKYTNKTQMQLSGGCLTFHLVSSRTLTLMSSTSFCVGSFLFFFLSLEGEHYCLYITIVFPPLEDCIIRKEYFGMSCWEGPDGAPTPYSISCEGKLKHCNTVQTHSVLGHEWQLICGACAGVQRVIFQKDWMSNIWLYSQPQNSVKRLCTKVINY